MSFPTMAGDGVSGFLLREGQVCLGPAFAKATYQFFVSGTSFVTTANVYQNASLTTPYAQGVVNADNFGRFPPIYLDGSVTYGVILTDGSGNQIYAIDPYVSPLSTNGLSSNVSYGPQIAATGEVVLPAPAAGGTNITLKLTASAAGQSPLQVGSPLVGQPAIGINSSATTGAQTATFTATNKPGTATSSPAGWLPLQIDGVTMYAPIWHGNNFTPYVASPSPVGESINATSVLFNGNGQTIPTNGTATPGNWFTPTTAGIGVSYFINIVKTSGLSGVFLAIPVTTTIAPSGGTYTGGTLTAVWNGTTSSNYTIQLSTGQIISGCTFTQGSATFTTPSTAINSTPTTSIYVNPPSNAWVQITNNGLTFTDNAQAQCTYNYTLSTSITGSPVVASGSIQVQSGNFVQSSSWNGAASLILANDGSATLNGASTTGWFSPSGVANVGPNFWINITRQSGTAGVNFSAGQGAWTSLNGGLTVGLTGNGQRTATGTYQLSANSAGTLLVGQGTITLTASGVNNSNYSGTAPLVLAGDGTATLNGVGASNWFSPTTANTGSGYWVNITRTGGTSGVNFSAAQGSWTNITNSGLSITLTGTSGNVGTVTASGTYQLSSSATGSPVLGSGSISLSVSGLTLLHVYTSGSNATETIPTGTTTVQMEIWGGGGGGSGGIGTGCGRDVGSPGGASGYSRSQYTAVALGGTGKTLKYTVGTGGSGTTGAGNNGVAGTITAGTVTGFTTMTANGGNGATAAGSGHSGTGGTASGGNQANTTGGTGNTTGTSGAIAGDGSPYGGGGNGGALGAGHAGSNGAGGAAVFKYS